MDNLDAKYLEDFLQYVRDHSPYYRRLWNDVPKGVSGIQDLPLTDLDAYWAAARQGELLMGKIQDGTIVRTGGTTSEPKVVYYTRNELHNGLRAVGTSWSNDSGIRAGDRIANLFTTAGMYGGFAAITMALQHMHLPHVHLPINGDEPVPSIADLLKRFECTVIMSNIFTVCRIVDHLKTTGQTIPSVRLILYAGETFYKDLRTSWRQVFPNVIVGPGFYASGDAGQLGLPVRPPRGPGEEGEDDDISPTYRVNPSMIILELIDEVTGAVITENDRTGRVFATDAKRFLHPLVRYPVGDIGQWVDYSRRLFRLKGREGTAVKLGTLFLGVPLLRELVSRSLGDGMQDSFQVVVRRSEGKNEVTFRIAGEVPSPGGKEGEDIVKRRLEENIVAERPDWALYRETGYIQPLRVEWVKLQDLVYVERTKKLKDIIEERYLD